MAGKHAVISGAGPVGALTACYLSKRGYNVDLYEMRADIRTDETERLRRSINLSLSERGRAALREIGLEDEIVSIGTKMFGRMIHKPTESGDCFSIPYGNSAEHYLLSVNRLVLNQKLLDLCESNFSGNVNMHFNHKMTGIDFNKNSVTFENKESGSPVEAKTDFDFLAGCDGLYSMTRRQMARKSPQNFSQTYIKHSYKELSMPANADGSYRMDKNFLHIWPRGDFMMIALANQTGSFTMTMFAPKETLEAIKTEAQVMTFFKETFPDSITLFGEDYLRKSYFETEILPLSYCKVDPYYYGDSCCLLGDSAHAIVPFYGQGLNAGMEDVLILENILKENGGNMKTAIKTYSDRRVEHGQAIADMALYNYWVMRDGVNSRWFRFKKTIANAVGKVAPGFITDLYILVSFSTTPYGDAWRQHEKNEFRIKSLIGLGVAGLVGGAVYGAHRRNLDFSAIGQAVKSLMNSS